MKKILIAACAAFALAGCSAGALQSLPTGPAPVVSTQGAIMDEQAMIALELAYKQAAEVYVIARDRNLVARPVLVQAQAALARGYGALRLARSAYDAGNADSFAAQAALVLSAVGDAKRLMPQ